MDDRDPESRPRGNALRRSVVVPALLVAACVAVAATVASPGGRDDAPAAELTPEESARLEKFVERFQRGQKLFYQGRDAEASQVLRDLLAERPDAAAVHHALGFVQEHMGDAAASLASFREAARLAPDDGAMQRDAGLHLLAAGHAPEAIPHLEAARKLLDPDVETILAHGHCLRAAGRAADAERTYRDALAADPKSVDARTTVASVVVLRDPAEALRLTDGIPLSWPDVLLVRANAKERLRAWGEAADLYAGIVDRVAPGAAGVPYLRDAAEGLVRCGDAARAVAAAEAWCKADTAGDRAALRPAVCLAVARAGAGDGSGALAALDGAAVPAKVPAGGRAHIALLRAHFLLISGRTDDARRDLAAVAALEGAPFESAAARRILGQGDLAAVEAAAKGEPGRSNDVEWVEALAATLAGDDAAALQHRKRAADLSEPPGEHPGLLLRVARRK